jgi:hypothetical protein
MKNRLESVKIFDEISQEEVDEAAGSNNGLADIIRDIDEGKEWCLKFYDLPLACRRIAFLYGYKKSLECKRELVRQFRKTKPRDIFKAVFSVPLWHFDKVSLVRFEDHIHFLVNSATRDKFRLPENEGRLVSLISDDKNLTYFGRQYAGTVSIIDEEFSSPEEAAYHERYHGLTHDLPVSRTTSIAAQYWKKHRKKQMAATNQNINDFLLLKYLATHEEVCAMLHSSKNFDEQLLYRGYYMTSMWQGLLAFYPEYMTRTIKGGNVAKFMGGILNIYNYYRDLIVSVREADKNKVQLYLELLRHDELGKLPALAKGGTYASLRTNT